MLPVGGTDELVGGQINLGVLSLIALAATGVYCGLRWVVAPLLVRALATGVSPGRHRLWRTPSPGGGPW